MNQLSLYLHFKKVKETLDFIIICKQTQGVSAVSGDEVAAAFPQVETDQVSTVPRELVCELFFSLPSWLSSDAVKTPFHHCKVIGINGKVGRLPENGFGLKVSCPRNGKKPAGTAKGREKSEWPLLKELQPWKCG